jgi:hypothetical protein
MTSADSKRADALCPEVARLAESSKQEGAGVICATNLLVS